MADCLYYAHSSIGNKWASFKRCPVCGALPDALASASLTVRATPGRVGAPAGWSVALVECGCATLARWRTRTTPICPAQFVGQQERQKPRPRRTHASASAKKAHRHRCQPHAGGRSTSPSSANGRGRRRRCRRRHRPQKPCRREHSRRREHRHQCRRARASTSAACGHCRRGRAP